MALKKLSQFVSFDIKKFLADKTLLVTGVSPLTDYETKNRIGSKVEVVIYNDKTVYEQKDGENVNNRFEKLVVKIPTETDVAINSVITLVNPTAKVYGEFRNMLSIKADDITIVPQSRN